MKYTKEMLPDYFYVDVNEEVINIISELYKDNENWMAEDWNYFEKDRYHLYKVDGDHIGFFDHDDIDETYQYLTKSEFMERVCIPESLQEVERIVEQIQVKNGILSQIVKKEPKKSLFKF